MTPTPAGASSGMSSGMATRSTSARPPPPRVPATLPVRPRLTLLAYSGLCGQGEFEVGEVAGAGAVQGMAVPPGIQPDQVERDGAVHVLKVGLGQAAVAGAT